jgi:hypothetical protein
MTMNRSIRIVIIIGMLAVMCGTVSAATSIGATNENPGAGSPNTCTAPCECISMNEAAQRWGAEGYETCSKSICGQSANAMTQYYCIHQVGGSTSAAVTTCQAPCECLSESGAITKWGTNGYSQCTKTTCGTEATTGGAVARYCFRQFGSTLLIGGATQAPAAAATAAQTAAVQQTVNVPAQTQVQTLVPANTVPPTPLQSPYPIQTKSPVGSATIIAAIGVVLLAVVGMRRK